MERCSGKGPLDLLLLCGHEVVIQDHRQIAMTKKDKRSGYGDSQRVRLTKETENGFSQIEAKGYRARLPDRIRYYISWPVLRVTYSSGNLEGSGNLKSHTPRRETRGSAISCTW